MEPNEAVPSGAAQLELAGAGDGKLVQKPVRRHRFLNPALRAYVRFAQDRVENPHIGYAEVEVFVDAFPHIAEPVVFRKYFDADQRRLREHRLDGLVTAQHAEVEDAKLVGAYADALLREHTNVPIALPVPKPDHQTALQITVRVFSHVSLAHLPVHVVAIGPVGGGEIFFDGNACNARHHFIVATKCSCGADLQVCAGPPGPATGRRGRRPQDWSPAPRSPPRCNIFHMHPERTVLLIASLALTAGAEPVRFNRDIRPIMSDTCFRCHGPDKRARMAGMRLDRREEALKPTPSGAIPI